MMTRAVTMAAALAALVFSASSAIAAGYGFVLTTPFKRRYNVDTSLSASPDGAYLQIAYSW